MKLNEIFTEWKTGGGIFSLMINPPWSDSITGLELDIEYFTNQSGTKQPSLLLLNFIEDNKISQNDVLTLSNLLLNRFGRNWTKLWNTLLLEYNPINNYDMEEKENLVIDEIINNSGESSNSSEIDSNRYAFDSETPTPTEGQRQTNSNEFSDNGTRNNTHVRELKRSGNIGVTTSQQMITAERDLWVWDFFKTVFKDVDSVLTVPIFSLDYCKKTYEYVNGNESDTEKYTLPVATALELGGVRAYPKTESDTIPVHIGNNGFLFVPTYAEGGSEYTLPIATNLVLGGVKADPKTDGDTIPVHIDSNGFLFVPTYSGGGSNDIYTLPSWLVEPILLNNPPYSETKNITLEQFEDIWNINEKIIVADISMSDESSSFVTSTPIYGGVQKFTIEGDSRIMQFFVNILSYLSSRVNTTVARFTLTHNVGEEVAQLVFDLNSYENNFNQ